MPRLDASFETRRDAEMAVERLVQEIGLDRKAIEIAPEGVRNTAGEEASGGDRPADAPTTPAREDAALNGRIRVSVQVEDQQKAGDIRAAFSEFGGR